MNAIRDKFYNIFWQNKSCQNIFLLSKSEFLDTIDFSSLDLPFTYSTNKIIISNSNQEEKSVDTIKSRTEDYNFDLEASVNKKIEHFEPIIIEFFKTKYGKQFNKLLKDIKENPEDLLTILFALFDKETNMEELIIKLLKKYHFIPPSINSFKEIQTHVENILIPSKKNELINERNIKIFSEGLKFIKELYVNHNYKRLYATNQILVNSLVDVDNFTDRIEMFHRLYEAKVLIASHDDTFVECHNCDPLTFRGTIQLKLNPKKLQKLTCPNCSHPLTYFVPYILDDTIFKIIQNQDGLLLDSLCYLLEKREASFLTNQKRLRNIEIDCMYKSDQNYYLIECKMYKVNTERRKLKSKIKEHASKLIKDLSKLTLTDEFSSYHTIPILLVNINDDEFISEIEAEFKTKSIDDVSQSISIININQFKNKYNF